MQGVPPTGSRSIISGGRSIVVLGASGLTALATVVVTVVAAHVLTVEDNAKFLVYWSLLFGVFQVMSGMQNEATRAVSSLLETDGQPKARVILMPLILGCASIAVVGLAAGADRLFLGAGLLTGIAPLVITVSMIVIVSYSCHLTLVGALAGRHFWVPMAGLGAVESIIRLTAVLAIGLAVGGLVPLELAAALPALTWLLLALVWRPVRQAVGSRADVGLGRLLRNGSLAMLTAGASAVLVNGFPFVTRLAVADMVTAGALASLLLAIQLTRAPMMIPLMAFQGVVISAFVAQKQYRVKALVKPLLAVVGAGVALALLMAAIGPFLMRLLYGPQYVLPPIVLGGMTFAAVSLALLTLSGAATLAISAHRAYLAGWWVGAIATVSLLFLLPLPPVWRVAAAVFCGPLTGVAVHLVAIARSRDPAVSAEELTPASIKNEE